MSETYTTVGSEMGFLVLAGPLTVLLILGLVRGMKEIKTVYTPIVGIMLFGLLAIAINVPMEWYLGIMFVATGLYMVISKKLANRYARFGLAAYMAVMGVIVILVPTRFSSQLVLDNQNVSFRNNRRTESLPRTGLEIHQGRLSQILGLKPSSSWTTFSGDNLGPDINGSMIYWGPNGLIRGEDVGRHFAAWAGVKPISLDDQLRAAN